jgi:hypothetical protein
MNSVSEMVLASALLRVYSRWAGGDMPNISVSSDGEGLPCLSGSSMRVAGDTTARQSFLACCSEVLANSEKHFGFVSDPQEAQSYQAFCIGLASLIYSDPRPPMPDSCSFGCKPAAFVILRDSVCPILGIPFEEMHVCTCQMPGDAVCDSGCVYISNEINDPVVETALIINYYIKRHDARLVSVLVKDVSFREYVKSFLSDVYGGASHSLLLFLLCSINGLDVEYFGSDVFNSAGASGVKTAQQASSFWLFGLIEKMLTPSRHVDAKIHQHWAPVVDILYASIDKERRRKGLTGAPLEFMLRVQSGGAPHGASTGVVQSMLEDSRSW